MSRSRRKHRLSIDEKWKRSLYYGKTTVTIAVGETKEQHRVHKERKWRLHGDGRHGPGRSKFV